MSAIRLKVMLLAVTTAILGGCGNEYDGTYQAARGFIGPLVVMQVAGSDATLSLIDVTTNRVRYAEVLTAETKNENYCSRIRRERPTPLCEPWTRKAWSA